MTHTTFNDMWHDVQDRLCYQRSLTIRDIHFDDTMTTQELKYMRDNAPHDPRFDCLVISAGK